MQTQGNSKKIIIAVDGHSSCGKGTLARYLAHTLGYRFIDSGSMYRCVALMAMQKKVDVNQEEAVTALLSHMQIDFVLNEETGRNETWMNGLKVEKEIRTPDVSARVSQVAKISAVRRTLVKMQQAMGADKGIVMDGRDIGTVVFPKAELKIFMTASVEKRAERRFAELISLGISAEYTQVLDNLKSRDHIDSNREDSPLKYTDDYHLLDNTNLSIDQQNEIALGWAYDEMKG